MQPTPTHDPDRTARRLTVAVLAALILSTALVCFAAGRTPAGALAYDGRIAFASDVDGDFDIYSTEPTGAAARTNLTPGSPARDTQPSWSKDGRIAFMQAERDGDADIFVMKADGTDVRQITNSPGVDARPTWSPDGTRLAFRSDRTGTQQVHVARLDQAGYPTEAVTTGASKSWHPSWGANGRIAFTSDRDGDREVLTMDADGTEVVQVTHNTVDDGNARWVSATRLVFQSKVGGDFEVAEIDTDGTHRVALTSSTDDETTPARSPSGGRLAYAMSTSGGGRWLIVSDADGTDRLALQTGSQRNEFPDWESKAPITFKPRQRIRNIQIQPSGTKAVVRFTTALATDRAHVELWAGTRMRWTWDQGGPTKDHNLTVRFLQPNTAYTVKVFAPKVTTSGQVTSTLGSQVKTLKRLVTFTYTHAYVDNDGDAETCGDVFLDLSLDGVKNTTESLGEQEICGGPWDFYDQDVLYHGATDDEMNVRFDAAELDGIASGPWDDSWDRATGAKQVTLVDDAESFVRSDSVHLHPQGDHLEMTVFFTYSVSYHN